MVLHVLYLVLGLQAVTITKNSRGSCLIICGRERGRPDNVEMFGGKETLIRELGVVRHDVLINDIGDTLNSTIYSVGD